MKLFECLLAGLLLFLCSYVQAQSKAPNLQGQIFVENHTYAESAAVQLMNVRDAVISDKTLSDKKGYFHFNDIPPGQYYVAVSKFNYQDFQTDTFTVAAGAIISIAAINLTPQVTQLREVNVVQKKEFIDETRNDKSIINVSKGINNGTASILDVLQQAPGVKVNNNGELTYKGGQPPLIMINGRATMLSRADVEAMLRNMPSSNIETVELYANPPSKFDATGTGGAINIIMKKGKDEGLNGTIGGSGAYGNLGKYAGNLGLNYRTKQVNIAGSFSTGLNNSDHTINTDRNVSGVTDIGINNHYYSTSRVTNPGYNLSTDFFLDSTHTLGLLYTHATTNLKLNKDNYILFNNQLQADSSLNTIGLQQRHTSQSNYNINYNGNIGHTKQMLSADVDYTDYDRQTDENIGSLFYNYASKINTASNYRNTVPVRYNIFSTKVDYTTPLAGGKLEAGLKASHVKSDAVQDFETLINGNYIPDNQLSSHFTYHEQINSAYTDYSGKLSKGLTYYAGLRVEQTVSDADLVSGNHDVHRNYVNFYPHVLLNYRVNDNNRFVLGYSRRTTPLSYDDLNPIISFQDKYTLRQGNAYLRPAYQDNLQFTYNYKSKLKIELHYSYTADFSGFTFFTQNDATKVFTTTKQNLKSAVDYGIDINSMIYFTEWWRANLDLNTSYQRYKDYDGLLNQGTFDLIFKVNQQFDLPLGMSLNVFGTYEVPTWYAIYYYRSAYYAQAGLSKKIHNKLSLIFTVDDIFNSRRDRYMSQYSNLDFTGYDKRETRIFSLGFIYQFGKRTVKASRKHLNGDAEEQRRIGNGGN